jgi:hypothetical protein
MKSSINFDRLASRRCDEGSYPIYMIVFGATFCTLLAIVSISLFVITKDTHFMRFIGIGTVFAINAWALLGRTMRARRVMDSVANDEIGAVQNVDLAARLQRLRVS